jgi:hypothetical protein
VSDAGDVNSEWRSRHEWDRASERLSSGFGVGPSRAHTVWLAQLEVDLVRAFSGLQDLALEDYEAFKRLFEQEFDGVVRRRRTRNRELAQLLVKPSPFASKIREALATGVYGRLRA